jgi:WD40 repeat protein
MALAVSLGSWVVATSAQQKCPVPPALSAPPNASIFTPQQEVDLGDVQSENFERTHHVIHDEALAARMNQMVAKLLAQFPPTQLKLRVSLIDLPYPNAYSFAGGRIYVSRKLIAFARNDQELAALLGHEMGHILSHQVAIDMTLDFREVLGVTSVGDRKDIQDKYNRFMDNIARDPKIFQRIMAEEEPHQYQADQVALYALANAGYSPDDFAAFFDRLTQTKGKTGGFVSDLFGRTTPNEKRLREIHKSLDAMPSACHLAAGAQPATDEFLSWQSEVIGYSGLGREDDLSGLISKVVLAPPLRNDIENIRFSPDGKYLLAQDDSSVFVLTRDPLRMLFRVDSLDAHAAQFTPDSQNVVFDTTGLRVEEWNIEDQERTAVHDVAVPEGCYQSKLSPDGRTLACVDHGFGIGLYNVADGSQFFYKKAYFFTEPLDMLLVELQILIAAERGVHVEWVHLGFSRDSQSFLAASPRNALAVNLATHDQIPLRGALPAMAGIGFAFLDSDQVAAFNRDIKDSAILKFPSGEVLRRVPLGGELLLPAAHGNYLTVGPLTAGRVGVLDLAENKLVFATNDSYAVDVYDHVIALQARNGEIALYNFDSRTILAHTVISLSPLGQLRASAVSEDLNWLALSGNTRGAVWDLSASKRPFFTRGFQGAFFDRDAALFADYPKFDPQPRSIVRLDLAGHGTQVAIPLGDDSKARQVGKLLITRKPAGKGGGYFRNAQIEVSSVLGGAPLWTRTFPKEVPQMSFSPGFETVLIGWPAETDAAKDELKKHPALQARLAAIRDRKTAWLLESLDARDGTDRGALVIDTGKGSFLIETGYSAADWVVIVDTDGRTRVYSLSTGDQKGAVTGTRSALCVSAGLLSVESQAGQIDVYDLASMQKRGQLIFSSPLSLWTFSADGSRMLALTKSQTVYTFDTSRIGMDDRQKQVAANSAK